MRKLFLISFICLATTAISLAQLKVLPSGNVGIGTTTTNYKLQVNGDILVNTGYLRVQNSGNEAIYFQTYGGGWNMTDATWIRSMGNKSIYQNSGILRTDGTLQVGSSGSTLNVPYNGNLSYRTNVLFANTSGKVGIGTSTPNSKLEITASSSAGLKINQTYNAVGLTVDASQVTYLYAAGMRVNMRDYTSKAITIAKNDTEKVWITPRGICINQWSESYNLWVNGPAGGTTNWNGSDIRYKQNIQDITNSLSIINSIRGVSYDYNSTDFPNLDFGKPSSFGVIAQEIETILPNLVKTDENGFKAVNYDGFIPILIEAIKQQHQEITLLRKMIEDCCKATTPDIGN